MAALLILLCILYLTNISEMHPQYNRSLQILAILESSPSEAPISSRGQSPISFIEMEDEILRPLYPQKPMRLYEEKPSYVEPLDLFQVASRAKFDDSPNEDSIVFPGPSSRDVLFVPPVNGDSPDCAGNSTICEDLDDSIPYPTDYITNLVESYVELGYMEPLENDFVTKVDVSQRFDAGHDSICPSLKRVIYPKIEKTEEAMWFYIVNTEKFQQGIDVDWCIPVSLDEKFTKYLPLGTNIFCKQKYINRKLIYINEEGKIKSDTFKVPSCCACFEDKNIVSRMGNPQTPASYNSIRLEDVLDKEDIVLPEPKSGTVLFLPPVGQNGPACAGGSTFCENHNLYPADHITKLINEKPKEYLKLYGINSKVDISQRIDDADESSICPSNQYLATPRVAQNKEGKWFYIVNVPKLEQIVEVERCTRDQPSLFIGDYYGYTVTCEQINMPTKLLFLNEDGEIKIDSFIFPSCCKCSVQNNEKKRRR